MDEVLFNLYYCYNKNGETAKAEAIEKLMSDKYGSSNYTAIATTGKNPTVTVKDEATQTYEHIYDLFIEGKFEEAVEAKKAADMKYGTRYWTPQLLYIEAVYYIKQRNDDKAKEVLQSIISRFPNSLMADKATRLIDVLNRRAQIERELTNLQVTRATDSTARRTINPIVVNKPPDTTTSRPVVINKPVDTTANKPAPKINTPFAYNPNEPHYVVLLLNKVDPVFVNETKNAFARFNRDTYFNKNYTVDLFQLDTDNRLLLIAPFANAADAIAYVDGTRPRTASEIIPWLKGGKYSFLIMTNTNFDILKSNKDVEAYKTFLNQYFPGKF